MLLKEVKAKIIEENKISQNDTGSCQVQVKLLGERIKSLQGHLTRFPGDNHSRLGLLKLVGKRRRMQAYLNRHSKNKA